MYPVKIVYGIVALAGPEPFLSIATKSPGWDYEIKTFEMPDSYGMFPDTRGYTHENYKEILLELEDHQTYPWMIKAVDCVVDALIKRAKTLDYLGYKDIELRLQDPKKGELIYIVVGTIKGRAPSLQ